MRSVYRVLAYLIAAEVVVQAAALAYAVGGLTHWVGGGGVLDSATLESDELSFPEIAGFIVHGINGSIVVPTLALLLVISSFFAHVPRGVAWAAAVLGLVVVQIMLGFSIPDVPSLGALHGANALAVFTVAFLTARRARVRADASVDQPAPTSTPV
jgi:heme A synthase